MTLMDGKRKVYRENYINLYGEFKNQYQQQELHTIQQIFFETVCTIPYSLWYGNIPVPD
jgi:hypothetical protein